MYYRIGDKREIEELKNRMANIDYNIVNINTEKYSMLLLTSKDNLLTNTAFNIIKKKWLLFYFFSFFKFSTYGNSFVIPL